ncbi:MULTISPECIES: hypothetical protein [unclassified Luteococcus]|uniref:hypothetical protein n=1 Tax=unclassified Luteococcus TaxID=2639923 RepID=UPI00313F1D53
MSAVKAWAQAAHELLVETAAAQQSIEYTKLARLVQQRSGINTKQPTAKWIAPLLGMIARKCDAENLPLLTALATRRDGSVGQAYDEILRLARIPVDFEDREEHAADQREACYRRWRGAVASPSAAPGASSSPAPARKPVVVGTAPAAKKTTVGRAAKKEPLQGNSCPRCFMQMSLTGVCDNCD